MNFIVGDSLTDIDFNRQIDIISSEFKNEIIELFEIRKSYLANPYNPRLLHDVSSIKHKIRTRLIDEQNLFDDSLFYPLEFFFCFFSPDGTPLKPELRGFDGIISNPPWEAIKPIKKEFAELGKLEMDILHFKGWFDKKLQSDNEFKAKWGEYTHFYEKYSEFLYEKYSRQSSGDPNYYKFFIERDFQLIKICGYFCLLVPSGFQTDEGGNKLREFVITNNTLLELSSFENRGYQTEIKKSKTKLFPDVDNRFKFSIIFAQKNESKDYSFLAKFYLLDPLQLIDDGFMKYDMNKIRKFSPENLSIMEFRSEMDYQLCLKILGKNPFFKNSSFRLRRELDMTNDSDLFHRFKDISKHGSKNSCRLYEGKMIHQFCSSFAMPRFFVFEEEARSLLVRKVIHRIKKGVESAESAMINNIIPDDLPMDYQSYRLVYRAIGRSTDERSLICSIVPKNVFIGHSMNYVVNYEYEMKHNEIVTKKKPYSELIYLMSLLNSLTLNYYIRNKISANLTMNFIYELPLAIAREKDKKRIIELGLSLLIRKSKKEDYKDLKNELNVEIDNRKLEEIRAELEIIIAKKFI